MNAIPYPAGRQHGLIGDRRTAALVAADGTIDWMCLPDYDGEPLFGALLDARRGGFWRLGPARLVQARQQYEGATAILTTTWTLPEGRLELTDAMLWPETQRPTGLNDARAVLRRLRCLEGQVDCVSSLSASARAPQPPQIWSTRPLPAQARFRMQVGEELWAVVWCGDVAHWSEARCREELDVVRGFWRRFVRRVRHAGPRRTEVLRTAVTIHLLAYAPSGAAVAAPTTSLPERIGGTWNADYRLSWIRDASLSMSALSTLGDPESAGRYLDWLAGRGTKDALRQPVFGLRGSAEKPQRNRDDLAGYRGSRPVRMGNHAYEQRQFGSLGFMADCVLTYVQAGGEWKHEHWDMICQAADHAAEVWREPDNSLWELADRRPYVMSRVMSWVALDRASRLAERAGHAAPASWARAMEDIRADVLERGWSDRLNAFRQSYDGDALDAAALLIPLFGFLPFDDERVRRTIDAIAERLTIDDFVFRFDPDETPGLSGEPPLGEYEGAFVPCTLWMAAAQAGLGHVDQAEKILAQLDRLVGPLGLLPEGIDPRDGAFRGNLPLLFSHAAYLRACQALAHAVRN